MHGFWTWLGYWTGISNEAGKGYGFWSGIGSCSYLVGAAVLVRHHNCHARRCWRLGRHPVAGTPYKTCRRHHPEIPDSGPTVDEIHAAARRQEGKARA